MTKITMTTRQKPKFWVPKLILTITLACTLTLSAQTEADLAAAKANTQKLGDALVNTLGSSFNYSLPFLASAGNYAPFEYGKLIPFLDFYVSGPIMIAGGKMDTSGLKTALDGMPGGSSASSGLAPLLGPLSKLPYFPAPPILVGAARARLQLPIPIVKDLEFTFKIGGIPGAVANGFIQPALPKGMSIDVDSFLLGIGARYRLINLKILQLGFSGAFNNLSGKFNVGLAAEGAQSVGTTSSGGTIQQKTSFNLTNRYSLSTVNLDLIANLNLLIFQLYGGAGLGLTIGGGSSSYAIVGETTATVSGVSSNLSPLFVTGKYDYKTELVPKLAVGFRFLILDVSAEASIPFNALALRAALAFSF